MANVSRRFNKRADGTNMDDIHTDIGNLNDMHAGAFAAWVRRNDDDSGVHYSMMTLHNHAGTARSQFFFRGPFIAMWNHAPSTFEGRISEASITASELGVWYMVIGHKEEGSDTPRFHIFKSTTGSWQHGNGDSSHPDWTNPWGSGYTAVLWEGEEGLDGILYSRAAWKNSNFPWSSDSAVENAGLHESIEPWYTADMLHVLTQGSVSTDIKDRIGNGDEIFRRGTSVISSTPPNFDREHVILEHVAAGGVLLGGQAEVIDARILEEVTGSGGLKFGGSADEEYQRHMLESIEGSGGIILGGQAEEEFKSFMLIQHEAEGGLVVGGTADVSKTKLPFDVFDLPTPYSLIHEMAFGADPAGNPLGWEWTDISADVKMQGLTTNRGRADESSRIDHSSASLVLTNDRGDYTPGHLSSAHFPYVKRGVPYRSRLDVPQEVGRYQLVKDDFARTAERNWGWASNGLPWLVESDDDGEFNVAPSAGEIKILTPGALKTASQQTQFRDGTIEVVISPGQVSSGGPVSGGVGYRLNGTYRAELIFNTDSSVDLAFYGYFGDELLAVVEDVASYLANDEFHVLVEANERFHSVKVWKEGDAEPTENTLSLDDGGSDGDLGPAGWQSGSIVLYAFASNANTNTDPTVSFTDLLSMSDVPPVFYGQVWSWAPDWPEGDIENEDEGQIGYSNVAIDASGFLRRYSQGQKPLKSAMRRSVTASEHLVAYWPLEDGEASTEFASAVSGVLGAVAEGEIDFASIGTPAGSLELPRFHPGSIILGQVPKFDTDGWTLTWLFRWDDDRFTSGWRGTGRAYIADSEVDGIRTRYDATAEEIQIDYWVGGVRSNIGVAVDPDDFFDHTLFYQMRLRSSGGTIHCDVQVYQVLPTGITDFIADIHSDLTSGSHGWPSRVGVGRLGESGPRQRMFGHFAVFDINSEVEDPLFSFNSASGHAGERAANRLARIASEESVAFSLIGDPEDTPPMGPQLPSTALEIMYECGDLDGGWLSESKWHLGLQYRTRASAQDQIPKIVLDAKARPSHIKNPFTPILDDQDLKNDITVSRPEGSSVIISSPETVKSEHGGTFDGSATANTFTDDKLLQFAAWLLALGTQDSMRYSELTPNLSGFPNNLPRWYGLELGDRIQVINLPSQHPVKRVDLLLQGVTSNITPESFDSTANMSPAEPWSRLGVLDGSGNDTERFPHRWGNAGSIMPNGLILPGEAGMYASTPSSTELQLTGPIFLMADMTLFDWNNTLAEGHDRVHLVGQWSSVGNHAYALYMERDGKLRFYWSEDGSILSMLESSLAVSLPKMSRRTVAGLLLPDNGQGGHTVRFFTGPSHIGPWLQLGSAQIDTGTLSLHQSSADLTVGAGESGGSTNPLKGIIHFAGVQEGMDGQFVANPDFSEQVDDTVSFEDGILNDWTINGANARILSSDFVPGVDTEMKVHSMGVQPWINSTDHASYFPFNIRVGEVILRVTSIDESTSPQTFHVDTIQVEGPSNTVESGTEVELANEPRFAL